MVQDNKATLTYTQLLKEDLGIFRLVPEDGVIPDYKPGQFLTIGMPVPGEDNKIVRKVKRKEVDAFRKYVKNIPDMVISTIFVSAFS